jgi:hypothetical protein
VYILHAVFAISSDLAPVQTTLPERKISAVVLGSRMRIMHAANLFGLYSELRECKASWRRSISTACKDYGFARVNVQTMFCSLGTESGWRRRGC